MKIKEKVTEKVLRESSTVVDVPLDKSILYEVDPRDCTIVREYKYIKQKNR